MSINCAALFPHPPLAIPEIGRSELKKAQLTVIGMQQTAAEITRLSQDFDLLVFITPHGPVFRSHASVIIKENLIGSFAKFSYPEIVFKAKSATDFAKKLVIEAKYANLALQALDKASLVDYEIEEELDHGILVPLYYLEQAGLNKPLIPLIIGLLPNQELYMIGQKIAQVANEFGYKIAVVASGDLSHRLKKGAPAGYNKKAHLFDEQVIKLLNENKLKELTKLDPDLINKAGECGLRPLIILAGVLDNLCIEAKVNSYQAPFGVGYGTAFIEINN